MENQKNIKKLIVDDELIDVCRQILKENKNDDEWSMIESSDYFQTKKYCGGYESIEQLFCFSYYENNIEYWFDFSLIDADKIVEGNIKEIDLRLADT